MSDSVYLEFRADGSSKFWSGSVLGSVLTTRWGKIGTTGQSKEEVFERSEDARSSLEKQATGKRKKGYGDAVVEAVETAAALPTTVEGPVGSGAPFTAAKAKPKARTAQARGELEVATASKSALLSWVQASGRTGDELASAVGRYTEVDRALASHANTSAEVLSRLSHSVDRATREKVTSNGNTPASDYVRLGQQFPKAFLENPLLYVLMLEDPGMFSALPESLLVRLAKTSSCPASFLEWGSQHESESLQLAVSVNGGLTPLALERLRGSRYEKVRSSVPELSTVEDPEGRYRAAILERLSQLSESEAYAGWQQKDIGVCQFRHLSTAARVEIAGFKDEWETRAVLAANPNLSEGALLTLSADPNGKVREAVARNPR
ncbi:MAG: WGR domain-containing protein, partial [Gammaproteobacteria bacterium]